MAVLRIAGVTGGPGVLTTGLIDTGADCTVIPAALARDLKLPAVGRVRLRGVAGETVAAEVSARLTIGKVECLARVVASGEDVIIGRDLLNRGVLQLDGPRARGSFRR